jgi:hypothetical protein
MKGVIIMKDNRFKLIAEGYLYSPWNGTLKEYTGKIYHMDEIRESGKCIVPEKNYFVAIDGHEREIKKLMCSSVEGEIVNKVLWLEESNIHKAAQLFIEYEETQISKLKSMIENHQALINTLKEL